MIGGYIGKPIGGVVRDDSISAILAVTLADATIAATGTVALKATLTKSLDDATISATGALAITGSLGVTLDAATLAATVDYSDLFGALAVTLDDVTTAIIGSKLAITDTEALQLPINCVLAGQQPYKFSAREYEIRPRNATEKTWGTHTGVRRLRGGKPSFTTTTNNRGYD